jgi:hypothetical protein
VRVNVVVVDHGDSLIADSFALLDGQRVLSRLQFYEGSKPNLSCMYSRLEREGGRLVRGETH